MFLCGELKILCGDEWVVDEGAPNNVSCIRDSAEGQEEERDEIRAIMDENTKAVKVMFKERGAWREEKFRCEMEAYEYLEDWILSCDAHAYEEWCHETCPAMQMVGSVLGKRKYGAV